MSEKRTLKTAETIRVAGLVILMIMISGPAGILTAESMADVTMNTARLRVISSTEARAMLERESGMVLLDVRTSGEFMAGRIPGAINIDLTRADFYAKIDRLDRNARYIVYCRTKKPQQGGCGLHDEKRLHEHLAHDGRLGGMERQGTARGKMNHR